MKKGFTLSELLITLAIIGVVAALVIPVVFSEVKAAELRSKFNKHYSEINNVINMMRSKGQFVNVDLYTNIDEYRDLFNANFKNTIDCNAIEDDKCGNANILDSIKYLGNRSGYKAQIGDATLINRLLLPDGTLIIIAKQNSNQHIFMDINGWNKKPNWVGYDIFHFRLDDEGRIVPFRVTNANNDNCRLDSSASSPYQGATGMGCTYRAINEVNYFKEAVKGLKIH